MWFFWFIFNYIYTCDLWFLYTSIQQILKFNRYDCDWIDFIKACKSYDFYFSFVLMTRGPVQIVFSHRGRYEPIIVNDEIINSNSNTKKNNNKNNNINWVVVSSIFYVHPNLGKWSNLTNIFQMGWNHQPVNNFYALTPICRYQLVVHFFGIWNSSFQENNQKEWAVWTLAKWRVPLEFWNGSGTTNLKDIGRCSSFHPNMCLFCYLSLFGGTDQSFSQVCFWK